MARSAAVRQRGQRTQARILLAARKEFGRGGFAGARIDNIARRAGVNRSLIFYYFQNKEGLSRAVAAQRLATYALPGTAGDGQDDHLLDWPLWLFGRGEETQDAVRYALAEGVNAERDRASLHEAERRRASFQEQVERVRAAQRAGRLAADLDTAQLTFLLYVLGVYPYMLPQGVYLITGRSVQDAAFRASFEEFLRAFGRLLQQPRPAPGAQSVALEGVAGGPLPAAEGGDPTRARILATALEEFGRHGYRGARIEAIARGAGVPRGLIAYYFTTKEGLFRALWTERLGVNERIQRQLQPGPDDPFAWSFRTFSGGQPTLDWVRMLIWEGLDWEERGDHDDGRLPLEDERLGFWRGRIPAVRHWQDQGKLPSNLDAEQLTFFLWVLGIYPYLVPQIAYLITGGWPSSVAFRREFERLVRGVAARMATRSRC